MKETSFFPKPLSIGELLDRAFRLYRQNFGLLLLTAAVLLVPFGIVSGLITGTAMVSYLDVLENIATQTGLSAPEPIEIFDPTSNFLSVMVGLGIVGLLVNGAATLALTWQGIGLLHDEKATLGQGLRSGFSRLLAYVGMMLLQGVALIGIFSIIAIVFTLLIGIVFSFVGNPTISFGDDSVPFLLNPVTALICLYPLTFLFLLVPLMYLIGRWSVATPALIGQGLGPIGALRYSWNMTKGNVRRSVIFIILLSILNIVLVTVPAMVISQLVSFFVDPASNPAFVQTLSMIISLLAGVIWIPLYTTAFVMFYFDLRVRKDGYDLDQRITQFETKLKPAAF